MPPKPEVISPVGAVRSFIVQDEEDEETEQVPPMEKEGTPAVQNETLQKAIQIAKSYRQARLLLIDAETERMASQMKYDAIEATFSDCKETLESLVGHLIMCGDNAGAIKVSKALVETGEHASVQSILNMEVRK